MHSDHEKFITSLQTKKKILLTFSSKEDSAHLFRTCAPMDFGPNRRAKDQSDRYHFWDYDSDQARHPLLLKPSQIVKTQVLLHRLEEAKARISEIKS